MVRRGRCSDARPAAGRVARTVRRFDWIRCPAYQGLSQKHAAGAGDGNRRPIRCSLRMTAAKRHSIVNQPWFTNSVLALLGLWLIGLCRQGVLEIGHFIIGFGLVAMYQALG